MIFRATIQNSTVYSFWSTHQNWSRILLLLLLLPLLREIEENIQRQIRERNNFCANVKNSRATHLTKTSKFRAWNFRIDGGKKVHIVPALEFRFPVPLEHVEDLIGENFRRRCFRVNGPRANRTYTFLFSPLFEAIHKHGEKEKEINYRGNDISLSIIDIPFATLLPLNVIRITAIADISNISPWIDSITFPENSRYKNFTPISFFLFFSIFLPR